jgi:hypothetical protein
MKLHKVIIDEEFYFQFYINEKHWQKIFSNKFINTSFSLINYFSFSLTSKFSHVHQQIIPFAQIFHLFI